MAMDLTALRAYAQAAQQGAAAPGAQPDPSAELGGPDFAGLVRDTVDQTEQVLANAEDMTAEGAMGQAELVDVVTAMAAAEVQLESVVAVRDQVIRAYQEILRMPI